MLFLLTASFGQVNTIKVKKLKPTSACFPNGKDGIEKYFDTTLVERLKYRSNVPEKIQLRALVYIDEMGGINKVDLIKGSTFRDIDSMFVHSFFKMPKWIPATNKTGNNCKDKQFVPLNIKFESKSQTMFH
ncbi:MAG TPA: hypothetical protein VN026_01465 [Bacteroidia bacterium]|nr:hypothetical protein [Bacteroidia bacterium]